MKQWLQRLFFGVLFAIPLMLITYVAAQASGYHQVAEPKDTDCASCHSAFQETWAAGAHGMGTTDPVFMEAWESEGKPEECLACHVTGYDPETKTWLAQGVTCQSCHNPISANHPLAPNNIQAASTLCSDCHTQANFEWEISGHSDTGVDCVDCHDPHATNLKLESVSDLCANCHQERVSGFGHTQHSQEGLSCADCHLTETGAEMGNGSSRLSHTFNVSLDTCNQCHVYEMHATEGDRPLAMEEDIPDALASVEDVPVTASAVPVSPLGFTAFSGLIGIGIGIVLHPWLDNFYRRYILGNRQGGKHE